MQNLCLIIYYCLKISYHPIGAGIFWQKFDPLLQNLLDVAGVAAIMNVCNEFKIGGWDSFVCTITIIGH